MRTTIELPDEVFQQAQQQAQQNGLDVNQFISTAVMKMIQAGLPSTSTANSRRVEFPLIKGKPGDRIITQETVDLAEEAMLKEEAEYYGKFMRR